jgi:hypothetical protein
MDYTQDNTASWSFIVDEHVKHDDDILIVSKEDTIDKPSVVICNTEKIMELQPDKIDDDVQILEYTVLISSQLMKNIRYKPDINMKDNNNKLKWLMSATQYFATRMGLVIDYHKDLKLMFSKGCIPRSSYKFCIHGATCNFNYKNTSHNNNCYAQHYVYNTLCADLDALIRYIDEIYIAGDAEKYIELCKSMKTISYVFKHMHDEIINVRNMYCKTQNDIRLYHIDKSNMNKKHIVYKKKNAIKLNN